MACFLTRGDLWQSWEDGAAVFDELLLDADWSINNFNWQWLSCSAFFYQASDGAFRVILECLSSSTRSSGLFRVVFSGLADGVEINRVLSCFCTVKIRLFVSRNWRGPRL